ncbi:hypothetical protein J2S55_001897 [Streptosporangium brasiliense]|uniref:Uncharacterized protein n=1 Tax=Streptosporangium brasiliense TaxID=47480 RepID=A0ABT9R088_9ACTN|nr:hypothetical protein [Streptosporangium brasiliense]
MRTYRIINPHVTALPDGDQRTAPEVERCDAVTDVGAERQLRPP